MVTMDKSSLKGMRSGWQMKNANGDIARVRLDFDPNKGGHYNIEVFKKGPKEKSPINFQSNLTATVNLVLVIKSKRRPKVLINYSSSNSGLIIYRLDCKSNIFTSNFIKIIFILMSYFLPVWHKITPFFISENLIKE